MPALLRALRWQVPCESGAFFWVDAQGEVTRLYAEKMPPPEIARAYFSSLNHEDAGHRFRDRLLEQVRGEEPVREIIADETLQQTSFYRDVLQPLGAHRRLYGVVMRNGAPLGQLSLYRDASMPSFSAKEREIVVAACRYLAMTDDKATAVLGADAYRDSGIGALLICGRDGRIMNASGSGYAMLAQASGCPINRQTVADELELSGRALLRQVLAEQAARVNHVDARATGTLATTNEWGLFRLRAYNADGPIGVLIDRFEHLLVRLVDAMPRHDLSVQQREVLLLLARGHTHAAIAEQLELSVNTVDYHVKQLFSKLGAHSRHEAIACVLNGHTPRGG